MTKSYGINIKYSKITPELAMDLLPTVNTGTLKGLRDKALLLCIASGLSLSEICALDIHDAALRVPDWPEAIYTAVFDWVEARPVQSAYVFTSFAGRSNPTDQPLTLAGAWRIFHHYTGEV
jgi:integrase